MATWRIYGGLVGKQISSLVIESCSNGWFYSAPLPRSGRMVIFFTDEDLPDYREIWSEAGWNKMIRHTSLISDLLAFQPQLKVGPLRRGVANTSRLNRAAGPSWEAVGDAAMAFDPLSSQGMSAAIAGGANAAASLIEAQSGEGNAISQYRDWLHQNFTGYAHQYKHYYGLIPRDYGGEFWKRRKGAVFV